MIQGWRADQHFNTITFLVRNENNRKVTMMEADLESGRGITLKNGQGKPIMVIKLPNNDATALGKLMHPALATLYKIIAAPTPVGMHYLVQQASDQKTILRVEKVGATFQMGFCGKLRGFLGFSL